MSSLPVPGDGATLMPTSPLLSRKSKEYEDSRSRDRASWEVDPRSVLAHVHIPSGILNQIPKQRAQTVCLNRLRADIEESDAKARKSYGSMLVSPLGSFLTGVVLTKPSQWVQLAGHRGDFLTGYPGTICKRGSELERTALEELMDDLLKPFLPLYYREIEVGEDRTPHLELQDLLYDFDNPSVMDVKMGVRTFLESEVIKSSRRMDLLEKMLSVDPNEPTEEERQLGITKLRYMQFRERESSSLNLGFRVEGIKLANQSPQSDFKKVKTRDEVKKALYSFLPSDKNLFQTVRFRLVTRLRQLRDSLTRSKFFQTHELVGTSLLFIFDHTGSAGVWMIDFGKTCKTDVPIQHDQPWVLGNHEDGYLIGLDNLIQILSE